MTAFAPIQQGVIPPARNGSSEIGKILRACGDETPGVAAHQFGTVGVSI
jgi:hypothetical protein